MGNKTENKLSSDTVNSPLMSLINSFCLFVTYPAKSQNPADYKLGISIQTTSIQVQGYFNITRAKRYHSDEYKMPGVLLFSLTGSLEGYEHMYFQSH